MICSYTPDMTVQGVAHLPRPGRVLLHLLFLQGHAVGAHRGAHHQPAAVRPGSRPSGLHVRWVHPPQQLSAMHAC
jgi:hypothetical protein